MHVLPLTSDGVFFATLSARYDDDFIQAYTKRASSLLRDHCEEDLGGLLGFIGGLTHELIISRFVEFEPLPVQDYHYCKNCGHVMEWVENSYACPWCQPYCFADSTLDGET